MARSAVVLLLFITSLAHTVFAQDSGGNIAEVYGLASQWSGLRIPGDSGAAGFRVGGAWRETPRFGWVADLSRHFVSDENAGFTTFLVGPRLYNDGFHSRYQPHGYHRRSDIPAFGFAELLVGSQRWSQRGQPVNWSLVIGPGVGIDVNLTDHLTFRPIEAELTLTRGAGVLRISSGFAFRFGH
jgi:hypothetical protein